VKEFSLESLIESAGERMRLDLAERLVPHKGELGVGREEIIRSFLRAYLPKRFDVSSGFLFDCTGRVSDQLDVIVSNTLVATHFETVGGSRFFPCESVVAVGQVKSSLTSRGELAKALKNLESAKGLDRSAGGTAVDFANNRPINPLENHKDQIFTFLIITGKALSPDTIHEFMMDYVLENAPHLWANVTLALDKYLVTFCCDGGVCPNPMDARGVAVQLDDGYLLMRFYQLLGRAIEVTSSSGVSYWEYMRSATEWSAETWFDTLESPPRYLWQITTG